MSSMNEEMGAGWRKEKSTNEEERTEAHAATANSLLL